MPWASLQRQTPWERRRLAGRAGAAAAGWAGGTAALLGKCPPGTASGSRIYGREGYSHAGLFQAADEPALQGLPVALLQIVGAQLVIQSVLGEQRVEQAEQQMRDRHGRLLLPQPLRQAMILGGEVGV